MHSTMALTTHTVPTPSIPLTGRSSRQLKIAFRGLMTQEALHGEVARIAREKLNPYGCDLVVHRMADGLPRFLIEVQTTGRRCDLIKSCFHRDKDFGNKIARHR